MKRARLVANPTSAVVDELAPEYSPESRAYGDQHWVTLNWARLALNLGARRGVVERITGIRHSELMRLFCNSTDHRKSPGGFPCSAEWYIKANLITVVHATDFYATFDKLRKAGNPPAEALIKAFEKYAKKYHHDRRLTFDRAFHLITHVDGLWATGQPELQAFPCDRCGSIYVAARWKVARTFEECPMCRLAKKYVSSVRVSRRLSTNGLGKLFEVGEASLAS